MSRVLAEIRAIPAGTQAIAHSEGLSCFESPHVKISSYFRRNLPCRPPFPGPWHGVSGIFHRVLRPKPSKPDQALFSPYEPGNLRLKKNRQSKLEAIAQPECQSWSSGLYSHCRVADQVYWSLVSLLRVMEYAPPSPEHQRFLASGSVSPSFLIPELGYGPYLQEGDKVEPEVDHDFEVNAEPFRGGGGVLRKCDAQRCDTALVVGRR
jgi:hypothetical protein